MIKPFHLSFVVPDLEKAKNFYTNLLGCEIARDAGKWIDIIFFGHQIAMHQEREGMVARTIDHFGPILEKDEWLTVSNKCSSNGISFEMPPTIKGEGTDAESGKYIIKDPAGNLLEFKYYSSFAVTVVGKNA